MARRQHLAFVAVAALFTTLTIFYLFSGYDYVREGAAAPQPPPAQAVSANENGATPDSFKGEPIGAAEIEDVAAGVLDGGSIAPKLENATAKAELGRATWHFLHTTMARFPETATPEDSLALTTFVRLFARLYPCGDCAQHFRRLIEQYPPQTSGRNAAAGWACYVHNEVNMRLGKDVFDCNKIGDFYDCGCGEEGEEGKEGKDEGEEGKEGEDEGEKEKEGKDGKEEKEDEK